VPVSRDPAFLGASQGPRENVIMQFDPHNKIIKICLEAMSLEEAGRTEEAARLFLRAWNEAIHDFEKFISAHFVARSQKDVPGKLKWLEIALQAALRINDDSVRSAFPSLYAGLAKGYEDSGEIGKAERCRELAVSAKYRPSDQGPFYHGMKADLQVGELLTAGRNSNYRQELKMNHIYFTALANGAGLAAALAPGDRRERVYIVEPTGPFENDPNVTDKKFPGNPTRSYRSEAPLRVVGELEDWARLTPEQLRKWREKLAGNKGEILN